MLPNAMMIIANIAKIASALSKVIFVKIAKIIMRIKDT
jgi:hypothetical protein